jgi:DNA-binding CsgD family transcriptional regulator
MATARQRSRCQERLERLSGSGLDCDSLRREAIADLQRVIGFDRWCWPLADPETLLPASGIALHDYVAAVSRSLELEYSTDEFAAKPVLARRTNAAASMSAETRGDLSRSSRWDEAMRPVGIGDVAAVACRDALGCWGWIEAYRDRSDHSFQDEDLELLASVAPSLGSALRRNMYADGPSMEAETFGPGVIVLDHTLTPVSSTAAARSWLDSFPDAPMLAAFDMLPAVIYPAAATARTGTSGAGTHAIVQAVDRRWVMIEAAMLEGDDVGQIAVTLRAATATETFKLLCRAYALSERERQVVAALVAGLDTRSVAQRLFISRYTVQDHLKSVFAKTGVRSRRELLARFAGTQDTTPTFPTPPPRAAGRPRKPAAGG